jgi:predicted HicB family RNase H-like nuclease
MNKTLGPYKSYVGTVELDFESKVLHGRIIGIKDVITYEGNTLQDLEEAFRNSLDDYLTFCEEQGDNPEKPYSGKFNLRINPELHKQLALEAANQGKSLNTYVEEILYARRFCGHVDSSPIEATL